MRPPSRVVDLASEAPSPAFTPTGRLRCDAVQVTHGVLAASPGVTLKTTQLVVAVQESADLDVTWRPPGSEQMKRVRVAAGGVLICPAHRPVYLRWGGETSLLVIAFKERLVDRVGEHFGRRRGGDLVTAVGARDMEIVGVARRLRRELGEGGVSGCVLVESLGAIALVRLFRAHLRGGHAADVKGGLGGPRFQRVVDHIEAHLSEPITIDDLAGVAGLSAHHFANAFRVSAGVAPYRFILERRIERACEMLERTDASITEIAAALGFASHGHFSTQFRKLMGTTPSKFRSAKH